MLKDSAVQSVRITGLDSMRGVAALIVVFNHLYNFIPALAADTSWLFNYTPVHWLVAGRQAVMLFFVLSGFVLALPYFNGYAQAYKPYLIRRFCRIYIPFFVVLLVAALLWKLLASASLSYAPHGDEWSYPVDLFGFVSHILMLGVGMGNALNPPMWTLIIEMRVSIIFPVLVVLVRRFSWGLVIAGVFVWYGIAKLYVFLDGAGNFYMANTHLGAILLTLYYVPYFLFGIFIASHADFFKMLMSRIPRILHFLFALLIFLMPYAFLKGNFMIAELWYGVVASYLVLICVSFDRVNDLLSGGVLQWLGKVSYSLYLVHMPVLLSMLYGLHDVLPLLVILALAFPLVFVVADLAYRFVEVPAMRLGKQLTKKRVGV